MTKVAGKHKRKLWYTRRDGVVRVIDFGLACLHDELREDDELTGTHQFVGSPAWMPPEQFRKSHSTDARNDLYSLGCTLFMLVTGELPSIESRLDE